MNYYKKHFFKLLALLIILVGFYLWWVKYFYVLDTEVCLLLNQHLLTTKFGQYFFGMLSHKNESWINVIVMLAINGLSIFLVHDSYCHNPKKYQFKAVFITLYCWLSFQIVLLINNLIFQKWLQVNRSSPSLIISDILRLSEILHNINIKDYSSNSFPAGHALILVYWALFINLYATKAIKIIAWLLGILLVLPRMVTGAHWLSDTIFSILLGWIYFNLSMWFATYYEQIKKRIY